jgi:hypothetical protein
MKDLRFTLLALLSALAVFFNIERLGEHNAANISSPVYVLAFLCVLAVVTFPFLARSRVSTPILLWLTVYSIFKIFFSHRPTSGHVYLVITEMTLPSVVIGLAHRMARCVGEFERTLDEITLSGMSHRLQPLEEAMDEIHKHLKLSRRNERPLSLLLVEFELEAQHQSNGSDITEVENSLLQRRALVALSKRLDRMLRRSDLMLETRGKGRIILICPETVKRGAYSLADRIRHCADGLKIRVSCGTATMPEDAVTFDQLLEHAEARLHEPALEVHVQPDVARPTAVNN